VHKVVRTGEVDAAALGALLSPRHDLLDERADADGSFQCAAGPFREYRRTVSTKGNEDGTFAFVETTEFRLGLPVWGVLFVLPIKSALRKRRADANFWWAPPARLDQRAALVLALLCTVSLVAGYLGTLITQTITFAAAEFHTSKGAQGTTLAAVRVGVLLSLVLAAVADRRGRRRVLLGCAIGGCLTAALGALAPNLFTLAATQTLSRAFSTALALLIAVVAAEEMPAGARAYAVSVMAMTAALGAGICLMVLPVADGGLRAWRILYAVPLLFLPLIRAVARNLPESRRFAAPHASAPTGHGRRLWLLGVSGFLAALFVAPASQFQNEFLRTEQHFSALKITLFTLGTNTPGGIGVVVGGKLADKRGRRMIGAAGLIFGAGLTAVMYLTSGPQIWVWSLAAAVLGAATVPALGVYGPELFPTSLRGRANGIISLVSVIGSGIGLLAAGRMADHFGRLGPGLAILFLGPLLVAVLVLVAYPETAMLELEELNPEDAPSDALPKRPRR
jgi:MFS family permease